MVRERFDESFERLRDQSNQHASVERSGENLDEVVASRVELDRRRAENTADRKQVVSRYEYPAPDVVLPARGYQHTRLFGKIAAGVAVCLIAVALFVGVSIVRTIGDGFPLELDEVVESVTTTDGCRWLVQATVRNGSDQTFRIESVETVLDRRMIQGTLIGDSPTLAPGDSATITADWNLETAGGCSAVDDIDHGNLVLNLDNGSSVSRGF